MAAAEQKPDVILLDVDLASTQGFEVCRRLKADPETHSIPILFLTSASTVEAKIFGLECGATDYLTKPFHPSELQARVRAALRNKSEIDESARHCIYDRLTELFDRKYFDMRLETDLAVARRSGRPLGCAVIDLDDMDVINTLLGRRFGDEVLRRVGHCIAMTCRHEDVVCRLGSDEFGVLVSDTDSTNMNDLGERLRTAIRDANMTHQDMIVRVTASIGFAVSRFSMGTSILIEAQDALKRARDAGGDCVRCGRELTELRLAG